MRVAGDDLQDVYTTKTMKSHSVENRMAFLFAWCRN